MPLRALCYIATLAMLVAIARQSRMMADALFPFGRPYGIGEVLDAGFRLYQRSVIKCIPYAAAGVLAQQLPSAYLLARGRLLHGHPFADPLWLTLWIIGALTAVVMWSAMQLRQYAIATGQFTDAAGDLRVALARLPATIVAAIATGLAIALGCVLLIVPGVYFATSLALTGTAVVVEKLGPGASLSRSTQLVAGNWWRTTTIFTVALLVVIVFYVLGGLVGVLIAVPLAGSADIVVVVAVTSVVTALIGAFVAPLIVALVLATYADLTIRRQGRDLAQRISAVGSS
ncbi:MAG TPA: hypothetical protein VF315_00415 [Steroidobacteraceae bacterium]